MSELMLEKLNEAERTCVDHLRQSQVLGSASPSIAAASIWIWASGIG
jgi:hypothetical protein